MRFEGAGGPGHALPGAFGDQGGGLVQRAGGDAVAVGPAGSGADELSERGEEAAGDVDVLLELAQDLGELGSARQVVRSAGGTGAELEEAGGPLPQPVEAGGGGVPPGGGEDAVHW
ncbi:hypothetical protein A4V12_30275 [Streptomyces noursei]|nr:hypothetical protein A4V12_30275 [Streptomyces noursei]